MKCFSAPSQTPSRIKKVQLKMDYGEIGIILAIVGVGLSILGLLVNRFNSLNKQIDSVETKLSGELSRINSQIDSVETRLSGEFSRINSQIDSVETRLSRELSQINSEIGALRELNVNRNIDTRIKSLEDEIRPIKGLPKPKKGKSY